MRRMLDFTLIKLKHALEKLMEIITNEEINQTNLTQKNNNNEN